MAILKYNELEKMNGKEIESKLADLKTELVKANVTAHKTNAKTKEIKKAIARIITFNASKKKGALKK